MVFSELKRFGLAGVLAFSLFTPGCATYKISTSSYADRIRDEDKYKDVKKEALQHSLYKFIPLHREQIKFYDLGHWLTWTFFGNDNDRIFGEETGKIPYSTNINFKTFCSWNLRNPMHNLTFYVPPLGTAGLERHFNINLLSLDREGFSCFKEEEGKVFREGNNSLQLSFNDGLPFISMKIFYLRKRQFDFYFGRKIGRASCRERV